MDKEKIAKDAWKEYYNAIKKYKLDKIEDRNHCETTDYMYDAFFTGFFAGIGRK